MQPQQQLNPAMNRPTEYGVMIRTRAKTRVIQWVINIVLLFLLIPALYVAPNRKVKVQMLSISALIVVIGQVAKSLDQDSRILANDIEAAARQARRQNLYEQFTDVGVINQQPNILVQQASKSTAQNLLAASVSEPEDFTFDINEAFDRPDYPHILLVAPSGSGKTTTLTWLAEVAAAKGQNVTVLTPHIMKRSEFAGFDKVTNDLEIYNFIDHLATEMKKRYTLQPWEDYEHKFQKETVIIDEAVTLFKSFKKFDEDYELDVQESWVKLLVEARKVGIKIVLATQSDRVKSLGLEGEGDIADCLVKMLIGRSAKKRVTFLEKKKLWTKEQCDIARSQKYFAVIDDDTSDRLLVIPERQV